MSLRLAACEISLHIPSSRSLKDKRRVLRRIKDRFSRANYSLAEVGDQDLHQRALLGIACAGMEGEVMRNRLERIVRMIGDLEGVIILDYQIDIY